MMRIKALVLTYDRQIGLAQLLIKKYLEYGCSDFLEFIIPINSENTKFELPGANIRFVKSKSDILSTIESLLSVVDDNEWIFWAIDDRYPTKLNNEIFLKVVELVENLKDSEINGIKLLPWREPLEGDAVTFENLRFFKQSPHSMFGFWHHHFLRAKVIKAMFIDENKSALNDIRLINNLYRDEGHLSFLEGILVSDRPIIELAEPLFHGNLTKNGYDDLIKYSCSVPEYKVIDDSLAFYDCSDQMLKNPDKPKFVDEKYFE